MLEYDNKYKTEIRKKKISLWHDYNKNFKYSFSAVEFAMIYQQG